VMERICQQSVGLFPGPGEIQFTCSCPDWASMCKHTAAVLYGIGARLDERPELLFKLRKVDEKDLIAQAGRGQPLSKRGPSAERVLASDDLSGLFGLEMEEAGSATDVAAKGKGRAPAGRSAKTKGAPTKGRARHPERRA
jgi:uncharacterized Zn finger protein